MQLTIAELIQSISTFLTSFSCLSAELCTKIMRWEPNPRGLATRLEESS